MQESTITIKVQLDPERMPSNITWRASESTVDASQQAKAMMLAFWDGADKTAMRIDLWTKEMMVDEMADFFYQTFMTMADTYNRATKNEARVKEIKDFAREFYQKFREDQMKQNASE